MTPLESRRNLPAVDRVLGDSRILALRDTHAPAQLLRWTREAVDDCRRLLAASEPLTPDAALNAVVQAILWRAAEQRMQRLRQVINATGILLHTNLGRAQLPQAAIERIVEVAGSTNLELDLSTGKRSRRGHSVAKQLAELVGAEAALIVNNCAAATVLVLQAIAMNREVIISRGQLVEIGGGFRLPEVFVAAGVKLCEVGTTNRTYVADYEAALNESTGAILRVHHSNFSQIGFVTEPSIDELRRAIAAADNPDGRSIPLIDDIGSGCLGEWSDIGLNEPSVLDSVRSGADLTLFSGDKLLGGPQCGLIVGRREWIECIEQSPLMRAMRVDKLTLAALEATLEIYHRGESRHEIPLHVMAKRTVEEVRQMCQRVVQLLPDDRVLGVGSIEMVACFSQIGGGAMPTSQLESYAIAVGCANVQMLANRLRLGQPAVLGRIVNDRVMLDLRCVADSEVEPLANRLAEALLTDSQREHAPT